MGSYTLDDVKEYMPICLPSTSEVCDFGIHDYVCLSSEPS